MSGRQRQYGQSAASQDPYKIWRPDRQAESDTERPRYRTTTTSQPQRNREDGKYYTSSHGYKSDSPGTASASQHRFGSSSKTLHHPSRPSVSNSYVSRSQQPVTSSSTTPIAAAPQGHHPYRSQPQRSQPESRVYSHSRNTSTPTPQSSHERVPSADEFTKISRSNTYSRTGYTAQIPQSTGFPDVWVPPPQDSSSLPRNTRDRDKDKGRDREIERAQDRGKEKPRDNADKRRDREVERRDDGSRDPYRYTDRDRGAARERDKYQERRGEEEKQKEVVPHRDPRNTPRPALRDTYDTRTRDTTTTSTSGHRRHRSEDANASSATPRPYIQPSTTAGLVQQPPTKQTISATLATTSGGQANVPPPTPRVMPVYLPGKHKPSHDRSSSMPSNILPKGISTSDTEQPARRDQQSRTVNEPRPVTASGRPPERDQTDREPQPAPPKNKLGASYQAIRSKFAGTQPPPELKAPDISVHLLQLPSAHPASSLSVLPTENSRPAGAKPQFVSIRAGQGPSDPQTSDALFKKSARPIRESRPDPVDQSSASAQPPNNYVHEHVKRYEASIRTEVPASTSTRTHTNSVEQNSRSGPTPKPSLSQSTSVAPANCDRSQVHEAATRMEVTTSVSTRARVNNVEPNFRYGTTSQTPTHQATSASHDRAESHETAVRAEVTPPRMRANIVEPNDRHSATPLPSTHQSTSANHDRTQSREVVTRVEVTPSRTRVNVEPNDRYSAAPQPPTHQSIFTTHGRTLSHEALTRVEATTFTSTRARVNTVESNDKYGATSHPLTNQSASANHDRTQSHDGPIRPELAVPTPCAHTNNIEPNSRSDPTPKPFPYLASHGIPQSDDNQIKSDIVVPTISRARTANAETNHRSAPTTKSSLSQATDAARLPKSRTVRFDLPPPSPSPPPVAASIVVVQTTPSVPYTSRSGTVTANEIRSPALLSPLAPSSSSDSRQTSTPPSHANQPMSYSPNAGDRSVLPRVIDQQSLTASIVTSSQRQPSVDETSSGLPTAPQTYMDNSDPSQRENSERLAESTQTAPVPPLTAPTSQSQSISTSIHIATSQSTSRSTKSSDVPSVRQQDISAEQTSKQTSAVLDTVSHQSQAPALISQTTSTTDQPRTISQTSRPLGVAIGTYSGSVAKQHVTTPTVTTSQMTLSSIQVFDTGDTSPRNELVTHLQSAIGDKTEFLTPTPKPTNIHQSTAVQQGQVDGQPSAHHDAHLPPELSQRLPFISTKGRDTDIEMQPSLATSGVQAHVQGNIMSGLLGGGHSRQNSIDIRTARLEISNHAPALQISVEEPWLDVLSPVVANARQSKSLPPDPKLSTVVPDSAPQKAPSQRRDVSSPIAANAPQLKSLPPDPKLSTIVPDSASQSAPPQGPQRDALSPIAANVQSKPLSLDPKVSASVLVSAPQTSPTQQITGSRDMRDSRKISELVSPREPHAPPLTSSSFSKSATSTSASSNQPTIGTNSSQSHRSLLVEDLPSVFHKKQEDSSASQDADDTVLLHNQLRDEHSQAPTRVASFVVSSAGIEQCRPTQDPALDNISGTTPSRSGYHSAKQPERSSPRPSVAIDLPQSTIAPATKSESHTLPGQQPVLSGNGLHGTNSGDVEVGLNQHESLPRASASTAKHISYNPNPDELRSPKPTNLATTSILINGDMHFREYTDEYNAGRQKDQDITSAPPAVLERQRTDVYRPPWGALPSDTLSTPDTPSRFPVVEDAMQRPNMASRQERQKLSSVPAPTPTPDPHHGLLSPVQQAIRAAPTPQIQSRSLSYDAPANDLRSRGQTNVLSTVLPQPNASRLQSQSVTPMPTPIAYSAPPASRPSNSVNPYQHSRPDESTTASRTTPYPSALAYPTAPAHPSILNRSESQSTAQPNARGADLQNLYYSDASQQASRHITSVQYSQPTSPPDIPQPNVPQRANDTAHRAPVNRFQAYLASTPASKLTAFPQEATGPHQNVLLSKATSQSTPVPMPHITPTQKRSSSSIHATHQPPPPTPVGSVYHARPDLQQAAVSTRVPASGPLPTPAPSRSRPSRQPSRMGSEESILMTPSSLAPSMLPKNNTPRPPPMPPVTRQVSKESKDSYKKKNGFLGNIFRSKTPAQKSYEVWHPSTSNKQNPSQSSLQSTGKASVLPSGSSTINSSGSTSQNRAPGAIAPDLSQHAAGRKELEHKVFSAFKFLHTKRDRTVSHASVEAQDGQTQTATNTVVGSPTQSTRSQPPFVPPPTQDPLVATQEWRNREEAEMRSRAKERRRRPGIVFDMEEDPPEPPAGTAPRKKLTRRRH